MLRILTIRKHTPESCVTTQSMLDAFGDRLSPELTVSLNRLGVVQRYSVVSNYVGFVTGREPARPLTTATRLAAEALTEAIRDAAIEVSEIGLLVAVTNTQSKILPGLAAEVMAELDQLLARDIRLVNEQGQGCSGLLKGIEIASWYLGVHPDRKVVVVAVEVATPYCGRRPSESFVSLCEAQALPDKNARQPALEATLALIQAFLFGDGAVAMVLGSEGGRMGVGPVHHLTNQQPVDREILWLEGGGSECPELRGAPRYRMAPTVRSRGPVYAEHTIRAVLGDPDTPISSIPEADVVLIHTGSKAILDEVCRTLRLDPQGEKVAISYEVLRTYGNLSAAAAGFMLEECSQNGVSLLSTFGLGFSASAAAVTIE